MEEEKKEQHQEHHHEHASHEHSEKEDGHKHQAEEHKEEPKHHLSGAKKDRLQAIFLALVIVLGIALMANLALTFSLNKSIGKNIEAAKEEAKPAKIELTIIKDSKCSDCYDVSAVADYIKGSGAEVKKENEVEFDSPEGKNLAAKYSIEKVPAVIVTGETGKASIEGLDKIEGALVFSQPQPPYTEFSTGKVVGRTKLIVLRDSSCKNCADLASLIAGIKGAGIRIVEEKAIDIAAQEGKNILKKYSIDFAPAIILSGDARYYPLINQAWPSIGTKESDGSYVMRTATPPYINLTTNKLRGMVNAAYLTDKSCAECYNVTIHREILAGQQGFGVKFEKEETVDAGDANGKEIIAKYNITKAPTVILSSEISAYPSSAGLIQFFSVEKDGSYVFRSLEAVGTYKDLASNTVVKGQEQALQ